MSAPDVLYRQCVECGRVLRVMLPASAMACPSCGRVMAVRLSIGPDHIEPQRAPVTTQEPLWGQQLGAFDK